MIRLALVVDQAKNIDGFFNALYRQSLIKPLAVRGIF